MFEELIEKLGSISHNDVEIYSFPQTWGSTALGFGGIGGQAFTVAQTTICFEFLNSKEIASVYFGKRFAYKVENPNENFYDDLKIFRMAPVYERGKYVN